MTGPTHSNRMQSQATCSRIHSRSEFVRIADQAKFQTCCTIISEQGDTVGPRLALERDTQGEQSSKHFLTGSESTRRTWAQRVRARWGMKIGKLPVAPDISPLEIKIQTCIKHVTPFLVPTTTPSGVAQLVFVFGSVPKATPKLGPKMKSFSNPNPATIAFTMAKLCSEAVPG